MTETTTDEQDTDEPIIEAYDYRDIAGPQPKKASEYHDPFMEPAASAAKMMGLSTTLKRKITRRMGTAESKQIFDTARENIYDLFGVKAPPLHLEYLAALYEINPYNYAAVNAKVVNVVGQGYSFVESPSFALKVENMSNAKSQDAARKDFMKNKLDLTDWLDNLNPSEEFTETLTKVYLDYQTTGNGYFEIGRDLNGKIGYIGHIPSVSMRVRAKRDGFVQIVLNKFTFFRNYGDQETPDLFEVDDSPNEVVHIKNYTPTNTYYGIPDSYASKNAIAGAEFAARYNLDYFDNKAVPRYVITVKGGQLSQDAERKLLEFFEGNLKGARGNHRSLYIPIPPDTETNKSEFRMDPIETGIQDSSFNEYRKANRDEVLAANAVPITKVSTSEGMALAVAASADKTFSEQTVQPQQELLAKKINRIIKEVTDALVFQFNAISLTDEATQAKIDESMLKTQVVTPNEVRAKLGKPNREGGNEPLQLTGQAAAEQAAQTRGSRTRDQQRSSNATDSAGAGRNPKGEGRTTP